MKRLAHEEARSRAEAAARALAGRPGVLLIYLFGSAARPGSEPVRDIDLALLTERALSLAELLELGADLRGRCAGPLELVSLNSAPVTLAREVIDAGVCLFAANPDVETEFVTRTRARSWDFHPLREEQWRLAGERLEKRLGPSS